MHDLIIQARKPLSIAVLNASQLIVPAVASTFNSALIPAWTAVTLYAYGTIVRINGHYYWCVSMPNGTSGAVAPSHTDGDATDGTVTWRYIPWSRTVISFTNVAAAGQISLARGSVAEADHGIVLYAHGSHNEGYSATLRAFQGAWYGISDVGAPGRVLAISEG